MQRSIFDVLFLKGFRAVESMSPSEYRVSKLLVNDTRRLSVKLNKILSLNNISEEDLNTSVVYDKVIKAFDVSEGDVETKIKTSAVYYDGSIGYVDVSGCIELITIHSDLSLLYEDLLVAFYKSRGGQCGIRRDFLNYINKNITETRYTKFIEI